MPVRPRKCCRKVRFTPVNMTPKWALVQVEFRVYPVNKGNQWVNPAKMAKTAPIESTQWKWATT